MGPSTDVLDDDCTPFASGFDDVIGGNTAFINDVPTQNSIELIKRNIRFHQLQNNLQPFLTHLWL